MAIDEDKIIVDARTPSDFALHAVFIRFAASAEQLIHDYVHQPSVCDISILHIASTEHCCWLRIVKSRLKVIWVQV